jgi:LppX_LprAFG lipoprotein
VVRPLRSIIGIAITLAISVGFAAGCGGGGGGGEDRAQGLTPAELLTQSSAAFATAESFRIGIEATGDISLSDPVSGPAALLDGPLELSGEGPVEPPDKASIDTSVQIGGIPLQVNLTRVGGDVFLGALGQDFKIALPPEQVALLDFGALYPTLVDWTTDPTDAGHEDIEGTDTVKVTGTVDAAKALTDLGPLIGLGSISAADAETAVRTGTVEFWIGTEDLLPRRIHLVLDADGSGISSTVGAVDIDLTANLSAYDDPVDITAPTDARELDLDELGSLIGG